MKKHLVMLHGFGTDSRVFRSVSHGLSKDLDVLLIDLPGHGQTKEVFDNFSFSAYTILHALDQHLKEPYHLLGWSMGGMVALEMFKQKWVHKCNDEHCHHTHNPIESLILVSSTPKFVESDDYKIGMNKAVFNKFKKGTKDDTSKTMEDFYKLIFSKNEDADKYLPDLRSQVPNPKTLQDCMTSFERFDYRKLLPSINIPTLLITGDSDQVIDPKASYYMNQEIKGSKLRTYKDTGHAPFLTREAEFIKDVGEFLK